MAKTPAVITISVKVTPRASSEKIVGWRDGELRLRVSAPPQDGRANAAVIALLAEALGVRRSAVTIAGGHAAPHKRIEIVGLTRDELERRLGAGSGAASGHPARGAI